MRYWITLKRIEVNLCYEVGITQFARISRFLFAKTFSATLVAKTSAVSKSVDVMCDRLSLDTLHMHPWHFFTVRTGICFHPVRCQRFWRCLILLCHAASRLHVWSFFALKRALDLPWAELGLLFRRPRVFSRPLPKKVFNLICSYVLIKGTSQALSPLDGLFPWFSILNHNLSLRSHLNIPSLHVNRPVNKTYGIFPY